MENHIYLKTTFRQYLYVFILCFAITYPQSISAKNSSSLYFTKLSQEEGLPSNMTNSVVQDKMGFIWIGTGDGICRYDGYNTLIFKHESSLQSLPSDNISTIMLEGDTLWVGTWDGLCFMDTKSFAIKRLNLGANQSIRCLYKSKDGHIWIGTSKGLIRYNKGLNTYQFFDANNSGISHATIRCFYQTPDSTLWIGTYDKLNSYKNGKFTAYDLKGDYKPYLKNNLILDITPYKGHSDQLLVGTETGLAVFNMQNGRSELYNSANTELSNEVIKCIHQEGSALWLGTDFGLSVFTPDKNLTETYFHNPIINHSIANNVIWDIFQDRDGVLYLLTSNGISLIQKESEYFKLHEEFYTVGNQKAGNQIRDILVANDGTLYLATIHGIIAKHEQSNSKNYFTASSNEKQKILLDNAYALAEDSKGRIWIGTAGGINIWEPDKQKMHSISANRNNGLGSNYISSIAVTPKGNIWVSAWEGGIYKLEDFNLPIDQYRFIKIDDNTPDNIEVSNEDIYYLYSNKIWVINHENLSTQLVDPIAKQTSSHTIQCMSIDHLGNVWMVSNKQLLEYIPQSKIFTSYPLKNALTDEIISIETSPKYIWMASRNTVIQYELTKDALTYIPLNPNYPLKNFYANCSTISTTGKVYFGGDNGYIEAIASKGNFPVSQPHPVISGISINNQLINQQNRQAYLNEDIAYSSNLELSYTHNSVSFYFSGLNYWLPEKGHFRYRLINFNDEWMNTQDVNFVSFSNLKPGYYTLEVEAINYAGVKSNKATQLHITILPPLLLSKPFLGLYILIFISLIYVIFRVYNKRQKLNTQLRLAHLEKTHSEEILNTKQQFFTNISHEFRTPLSLITPPIQQVINTGVLKGKNLEMLKLAEKNSKRLLKLVNQILDFRKLEDQSIPLIKTEVDLIPFCRDIFESFRDMASRNEVQYEFKTEIDSIITNLDKEKIEAVLYNLLGNAFKYTPAEGAITILIQKPDHGQVKISVSDTGPGISKNEVSKIFERFYQVNQSEPNTYGTGIGLAMAQQYSLLHNGNISVESSPGKGSTFTLSLPVEVLSGSVQIKQNSLSTSNHIEQSKLTEKTSVQLPTLLAVDDNPDILDYIEMNLSDQFTIQKAINGSAGFELALKTKPDIIVSDIMMPVMDGIEMCQKIKSETELQRIPVILLTAKSLDVQKTEGIESGANMYITKPFNISYLKACINRLLKSEEQLYSFIRKELLVSPNKAVDPENNQDELFIKKMMEIIEQNLSNSELSVDMISSKMGYSSTHVYRKVKSITNQSTKDILKNYRLKKAAEMIKNNEGNVTEVMYNVGFNSLSSFSKSFKTMYGVSPSEYK